MAESENFEEDLFADLYEDGDAPKGATGPQPPKPAEPVAPSAPAPQTTAAESSNNQGGNAMDEGDDDDDDDVDFNLGGGAGAPTSNSYAPPEPEHELESAAPAFGTVHKASAKDDGKMFIGGLNWETTDQSLRDYFSQFGEVVECTVMRDSNTGRSRGFGFLTFKDAKTVNIVMVKEHYLDGKIIDPKRAIPRDEQEKTSKIFVGGVSQDTTDQEFREFFAQFGRVIDATLMMDKDTGRPRGFGFVTFESEAGVDACINIPLEIHGKPIEVKRAQPRGNLREEEDAAKRNKFKKGDDQGQGMQQMGNSGMTPQVMAQYFQRMQQYFTMMQSQMAMNRGMNNMNPAMWQNMMQMQQMQQMMGRGGGGQGGSNMMANMNPQMMQQMQQQMMQQQQQQHQQQQQGSASPTSQSNGGGGGSQGGFDGNNFDQFQQQPPQGPGGARRGGRGGFGGQGGYGGMGGGHQGGNATSWEGMYDDPQPGGYGRGGHDAPPANAPTGPKNPGRGGSGGNYRGGGRGGGRGGFHPYAR
ncbi:RNA recognition protein, RNP-1 [Cordyceps militaris CM01]|uniref:RNA recognition protein, RNP-1 n=1 Tax=Cordyceps militaris (strain CM01) TaxID=983644 RepID=G3J351_CORMM|nr:RNA recognition protein, RNP-1 [Cordyceps militaris CM01]EGX96432.1 RNA recognition protein, RNP-1 [Cordyceps militaris CM01]